ncbi:MAG: hypothetical protein Q8P61_01700 [Candidatus Nanopelagicales bacterium]|nr:hypothetical protein [Candidatus Nanopelagicales bacterium]
MPETEFDALRAAWLSTDPARLAYERIKSRASGVAVAGESAAALHRIGDYRAASHDFVSPARRQSQRKVIRYRQRFLDPQDVTVVEGLPVMTIERTIADLVEDRKDLGLVANALRDASAKRILDLDRLRTLLAPLAARNGFRKGEGGELLERLQELAGIDINSTAERIAAEPALGALIAANYINGLNKEALNRIAMTPEMQQIMLAFQQEMTARLRDSLAPQLEAIDETFAALANFAKFTESIREATQHVLTSEALKELNLGWMKALSDSLIDHSKRQTPPDQPGEDMSNTSGTLHTSAELAELFGVARSTVYRAAQHAGPPNRSSAAGACR